MTVNQLLFERRMTRKSLGEHFGVTQSVMSRKLRGEVTWTAEELAIMASLFGLSLDELTPTRYEEGWVPAEWRPGMKKASAPSGMTEAAGTPCGARTHDLRIKSPQL